jgi:hypothetical protein
VGGSICYQIGIYFWFFFFLFRKRFSAGILLGKKQNPANPMKSPGKPESKWRHTQETLKMQA